MTHQPGLVERAEFGAQESSADGRIDHRSVTAETVSAVTVSAVICCYTERRWDWLVEAIESARAQTVHADVVVVVDHNDQLWERLRTRFSAGDGPEVRLLTNRFTRGLSGARNTALADLDTDVIAFLDDDATAPPDWIRELASTFVDSNVVATGGGADPRWPDRPPRWFPMEFGWVVGCSYIGMRTVPGPVRNVIGCNMAIRRVAALAVGGFSEGLGRTGADVAGCEETLLCIEMGVAEPQAIVMFLPELQVGHRVSKDRVSPRYFLRRCYGEGRSKALVVAETGAEGLRSERSHVLSVLPAGVLRGSVDLLRGDVWGPLRSLMIFAGTAATAVGYSLGRYRLRTASRSNEDSSAGLNRG